MDPLPQDTLEISRPHAPSHKGPTAKGPGPRGLANKGPAEPPPEALLDPSDRLFFQQVEDFVALLKRYDFKCTASSELALVRFKTMKTALKEKIKKNFLDYASLLQSAAKDECDLRDEEALLRKTAKRLNIVLPEKLFSTLQSGLIIEIYNREFVQIYRNPAMFDICGYSVLDLLVFEFYELYERSDHVNEQLIAACQQAAQLSRQDVENGESISLQHVPRHLMREKFSEERVTSYVEFKRLYAVYYWPHELFGFMTMQKATPVLEVPTNIRFI